MTRPEELSRLRWRARRGLLENDIFLARFLNAPDLVLSDDDLDALAFLLDLSDPDLLPLLTGAREVDASQCAAADLRAAVGELITRIRASPSVPVHQS